VIKTVLKINRRLVLSEAEIGAENAEKRDVESYFHPTWCKRVLAPPYGWGQNWNCWRTIDNVKDHSMMELY